MDAEGSTGGVGAVGGGVVVVVVPVALLPMFAFPAKERKINFALKKKEYTFNDNPVNSQKNK